MTSEKADEIEKEFRSKDITLDHLISIGKSIYPNNKKHKLATPKTFEQNEKRKFNFETEYFSTKKNLVKIIVYEWTELKLKRFFRK